LPNSGCCTSAVLCTGQHDHSLPIIGQGHLTNERSPPRSALPNLARLRRPLNSAAVERLSASSVCQKTAPDACVARRGGWQRNDHGTDVIHAGVVVVCYPCQIFRTAISPACQIGLIYQPESTEPQKGKISPM